MQVTDDIMYGRTALREGVPWIVPDAFEFLKEIYDPSWSVFEWGAGGSTLWFARECAHVVSVEHHHEWYGRIWHRLYNENLIYRKAIMLYFKADQKECDKRFKRYADIITLNPTMYDLVFVDGEASSRGWCLANALEHVLPGGWLMVDNSDWIKKPPAGWEKHEFKAEDLKWIGMKGTFTWWTTLFRRPDE